MNVKTSLDEADATSLIAAIKTSWKKINPGQEITYDWFDRQFYAEQFIQNRDKILEYSITEMHVYNFQDALFGCLSPVRQYRPHWWLLTEQRQPY